MFFKFATVVIVLMALPFQTLAQSSEKSSHYVRYEYLGETHYGVLLGEEVRQLRAGIFPLSEMTDKKLALDDIKLLPPSDAGKVFAVGMNFASHIASASKAPPPMFLKLPSSLTGHEQVITVPKDAGNVHFEGELVLMIGKQAKNISEQEAGEHIFGVSAGNDLTERSWQGSDLQWMRSKASDGFGPVGPSVVTGLDWNNLLLTTRLNGEIVQQENTNHMIHKPEKVVSYLSQYFTLEPGDMIFMGTPGRTSALNHGDEVSVEIEGVGLLRNLIEWP
ncbi:fumarylacetoacetate hydrolase family protein [Kiloniella antarctica]|uniref:Fumarylacetoacetate hydrolase family protein n=1 Tax=Kiloniella antarctica TaxID=1550907 RepID=A0ABW5BL20_9PROT